ncbi:hypothetical protein ACWATR_39040 [Nostoc sp. UIC 10890]
MIIKEAVQFINLSADQPITPKQLINQLQGKYPALNFNESSEVPEEFLEALEKRIETKKQQDQTVGNISKADPKNSLEAIQDSKNSDGFITECIDEILSQPETILMFQKGIKEGLNLIHTYENAKNQVIGKYAESQADRIENEADKLQSDIDKLLMERATERQETLGKYTRLRQNIREKKQATDSYLDAILSAL